MEQCNKHSPRRPLAYISILGISQLHLRNPFIIAFWSAAFPGSGHILLCKYLRGYLLFIWEVFINYKANINLLILYSFIGDFEKAKAAVDIQWLLLYIPSYIFAIWDSYRSAVDLNQNYMLAAREDAEIDVFKMNLCEVNFIDKRKPWVSALWSLMMPGSGQLYNHRITTAFFVIVWWIVVVYLSKLLPAIHHSFLADFAKAKAVIDMHWFLNIPSIYFFSIYSAYANTVEENKLFDWEQSRFLKRTYQNSNFTIPINNKKGDKMYIFSTFEHSRNLELAITAVQMKGIKKENILAVSMDKRNENRALFDSIHSADGVSTLDVPLLLASFLGTFGSIYGFIIPWGPLFGGLIGIFTGIIMGLLIKSATVKKHNKQTKATSNTEVVLLIECSENQSEMVKDTLWAHHAFGVSKLDMN